MRHLDRAERLALANELLPLFLSSASQLTEHDGKLWFTALGVTAEATVKPSGVLGWNAYGQGIWNTTQAGVLAALLRWINDEPRFPLSMWGAHNAPEVQARLQGTDFDDPARTCCIFCGSAVAPEWWGHADCWGPGCLAEACGVSGDRRAQYLERKEVGDE
jgi:hypothetical protein